MNDPHRHLPHSYAAGFAGLALLLAAAVAARWLLHLGGVL